MTQASNFKTPLFFGTHTLYWFKHNLALSLLLLNLQPTLAKIRGRNFEKKHRRIEIKLKRMKEEWTGECGQAKKTKLKHAADKKKFSKRCVS